MICDVRLLLRYVGIIRRSRFASAQEAALDGLPDLAVLEMCAKEERILITHDVTTISKSLRSLMDQGISSPGVFVLVPRMLLFRRSYSQSF